MGRYIPIGAIERRKDSLKYGINKSHNYYPLYKTYRKDYNYYNLRESLYNWYNYTGSVGDNLDRVLEIFDIISTNGTDRELKEASNIINSYVVPYLESPSIFKKDITKKLNKQLNQPIRECLESINDKLNDEIECDRLIRNHSTISKRFNIDKVVGNGIVYEDAVTDTIYTLCSLIDTYDMDMKSKFCISTEMALYTIDNTVGSSISQRSIVENVIDYYMINYGTQDIDKFVYDIKEAAKKDRFIHESSYEYLDYISNINKRLMEDRLDPDEIIKQLRDDSVYGLNEDMNQYDILNNSLQCIYEIAILDKAKAFITKLKMMPIKTIDTLKNAIRSLFVTNRAEDIRKGTHNALSLAFYGFITLSAFSLGMLPGILGLISSFALSKKSNQIYLKTAMDEFRDHKYSLQRKIKTCDDPEKKRRMEAYLDDLDKNIKALEDQYEKQRDRTLSELKEKNRVEYADDNEPKSAVKQSSFIDDVVGAATKIGKSFTVDQDDDKKEMKTKDTFTTSNNVSDPSIDDEIREYEEYMRQRKGGK